MHVKYNILAWTDANEYNLLYSDHVAPCSHHGIQDCICDILQRAGSSMISLGGGGGGNITTNEDFSLL